MARTRGTRHPTSARRAWAGSPISPRGTHTRTPIYETRTAHKGPVPPLCAVPCCLIPSLVCDTGGWALKTDRSRGVPTRKRRTRRERGC